MAVVGFSFTKFDCEKVGAQAKGSIEIKHNVNITSVEKTNLNLGGSKTEVLRVIFAFDVLYGAEIGKISIAGDVIYTDTKEIVSETIKGWNADKKLNPLVNEQVHKFVYNKAIVRALELSDALNLPAPIPLPKVSFAPPKK